VAVLLERLERLEQAAGDSLGLLTDVAKALARKISGSQDSEREDLLVRNSA